MDDHLNVWIVMPALNEEASIGLVLDALPHLDAPPDHDALPAHDASPMLSVVVADNGSTDRTAEVARSRGATVVLEERRGYGQACLTALDHIAGLDPSDDDVVAFLDADFSDDPRELDRVLAPILRDDADLVIGSRILGNREPGALLVQARWGNWLAGHLIHAMTGVRFTDLGPFRAIRWGTLRELHMRDRAFGWTVEMQLKAASAGLRCVEVPVSYRKRVGQSKITGTLRGTVLASVTILSILGRWALPGHGGLK